ncbi:MAG TPA: hypothetical protein VGC14_21530 [Rhizobium sp.]
MTHAEDERSCHPSLRGMAYPFTTLRMRDRLRFEEDQGNMDVMEITFARLCLIEKGIGYQLAPLDVFVRRIIGGIA